MPLKQLNTGRYASDNDSSVRMLSVRIVWRWTRAVRSPRAGPVQIVPSLHLLIYREKWTPKRLSECLFKKKKINAYQRSKVQSFAFCNFKRGAPVRMHLIDCGVKTRRFTKSNSVMKIIINHQVNSVCYCIIFLVEFVCEMFYKYF